MTQFLAIIFLMMMVPPALFAVMMGARTLFGYIWSGIWFYVIGQTAAVAFQTPEAESIGIFLFILFVWRSLVFRPKATFTFQRGPMRKPKDAPPPRANDADVIEAEVIDVKTTQRPKE